MRAQLRAPLLFGALARVIAAFSGFGYFASDDYTHVLAMAYRWLDGPAPYNSEIRSPLLARIVWVLFETEKFAGVRDPAWLVRWAYLALGLFSLLTIPGVFALAEKRLGTRAATMAAWLVAVEALMPRIVTRALISVVAMVPLVWGTVLVDADEVASSAQREERARWFAFERFRRFGLGGLLLGIAAMFRFQVGIVAATLAILVVVRDLRIRRWDGTLGVFVGGLVAALLQGVLDVTTQGAWFASIIGYVRFNSTEASRYGTSPWFTYVLDFLALTVPPLTLWLAKPLWTAARKHVAVSIAFAVFALVHSLVPHKEEHFIFAVLPYFFVLLGAALSVAANRVVVIFWIVNTLALIPVTFSDGHRSLTWPLLQAGRDGGFSKVIFIGKALIPEMYAAGLPITRVLTADEAVAALDTGRIRLLAERAREMPEPSGWSCTSAETVSGDFIDRALIWVNPINRRRAEKFVMDCEQP